MMDKYKEAIHAIKSNYPPSNYTMLRDGLDLAIEALEKQAHYEELIEQGRLIELPRKLSFK